MPLSLRACWTHPGYHDIGSSNCVAPRLDCGACLRPLEVRRGVETDTRLEATSNGSELAERLGRRDVASYITPRETGDSLSTSSTRAQKIAHCLAFPCLFLLGSPASRIDSELASDSLS
eukprot:3346504-Rhodomonas_salina.2